MNVRPLSLLHPAAAIFLLIAIAPASRAAAGEPEIEGLNKEVALGNPAFDCSRGYLRCRYTRTTFGPFALSRAEAQFGSGKLDWLLLNFRASKKDVLAWLIEQKGPPTGQLNEGRDDYWTFGHGVGFDLFELDGRADLRISFRDTPPLHEACTDAEQEAWFDIAPPKLAMRATDDDEERC